MEKLPVKAEKSRYPKLALAIVLSFIGFGLFYLLSFGPVLKYFVTTTTSTLPPTQAVGGGIEHVHTVATTFPVWVHTLYYPVISLGFERLRFRTDSYIRDICNGGR